MIAIRLVTVAFDSGVSRVVAESKFRWSKTKVLGNSESDPFIKKVARLKLNVPSSTESTVPQGSVRLASFGPVGALQERHPRSAAMIASRGNSHPQMGNPFFSGVTVIVGATGRAGAAAPQRFELLLRPKALANPGGAYSRIVSRCPASRPGRLAALTAPDDTCLPSNPNSRGADRPRSLVAEDSWIPEKFAITLATAPTRSPSNPLSRPEPVFSNPSVAVPPLRAPEKLLSTLESSPLVLRSPSSFEAPPGLEAWLQAMPARLGTMAPTAFWVAAGDSPTSPDS